MKKKSKRQVPLAALLGLAIVIVAAAGYFALIRPKHAEAQKLDQEIQALDSELAVLSQPKPPPEEVPAEERIKVADLVRLGKAMPDEDDMAGVLLELDAVAAAAGVEFLTIQPQPAIDEVAGYRRLPIQVTFDGNYYDLVEVLYDLRGQVRVRDGRLAADGRLFALDQVDLHESQEGFPQVEALMTISAYLFGSAPVDAAGTAISTPVAPAVTTPPATTTGATATETIQQAPPAAPAPPVAPPAGPQAAPTPPVAPPAGPQAAPTPAGE